MASPTPSVLVGSHGALSVRPLQVCLRQQTPAPHNRDLSLPPALSQNLPARWALRAFWELQCEPGAPRSKLWLDWTLTDVPPSSPASAGQAPPLRSISAVPITLLSAPSGAPGPCSKPVPWGQWPPEGGCCESRMPSAPRLGPRHTRREREDRVLHTGPGHLRGRICSNAHCARTWQPGVPRPPGDTASEPGARGWETRAVSTCFHCYLFQSKFPTSTRFAPKRFDTRTLN